MKIVCLDRATHGDADLHQFADLGELVLYELTPYEEAAARIADADVVIVNKVVLDEKVIAAAPRLKLILLTATGADNIAVDFARSRGIAVKNVAGYSTETVAQHTFALLFYFYNEIAYYNNFTKSGAWQPGAVFAHFVQQTATLAGKRWGIIGLGAIGKKVAQIAQAFGAEIVYFSTSGKNQHADFPRLDLNELLKTSDVVSIHAPLNEKTRHLIGRAELLQMKDSAVLINVGRGGIIDEDALAAVLDEKPIRAALDVLEKEPMKLNHPFFAVKNQQNLLVTPHVAFASKTAMDKLLDITLENFKEWLKEND